MQPITPCLAFPGNAEEAVNFYLSIFDDSRIVSLVRSQGDGPVPKGQLLHATFELGGQRFTALTGGPEFTFGMGTSFVATCDSQEELDRIYGRLLDGGEEQSCGWLRDRYGLSWQVVPAALGEMMGNPAGGDTARLMQALFSMRKLDIAALRAAYAGG